jgi:hypothetical protein
MPAPDTLFERAVDDASMSVNCRYSRAKLAGQQCFRLGDLALPLLLQQWRAYGLLSNERVTASCAAVLAECEDAGEAAERNESRLVDAERICRRLGVNSEWPHVAGYFSAEISAEMLWRDGLPIALRRADLFCAACMALASNGREQAAGLAKEVLNVLLFIDDASDFDVDLRDGSPNSLIQARCAGSTAVCRLVQSLRVSMSHLRAPPDLRLRLYEGASMGSFVLLDSVR